MVWVQQEDHFLWYESVFHTSLAGRRHHDNTQTNKPVRRDSMVLALSAHYIMLIRPKQAPPLARIYCKLFIFKYILEIYKPLVALIDSHKEKENDPYIFLRILYRMLYFGNYRWQKLAKIHKAKERHTPSLSNQTSVYTIFPEGGVVWNLP